MHEIKPPLDNILWVRVNGELTRDEYRELVPSWEKMIARHGRFRLLFQIEPGFEGWQPGAAWDDFKFSHSHQNELEKVAIVGAKKWHEPLLRLSAKLVNSEVRFFGENDAEAALDWLKG